MDELLESAIVRIHGDNQPVGVGFLVGPTTILTCRHVVESALDGRDVVTGACLDIDFPLLPGVTRRVAAVAFVPSRPDVDVATLRVTPPDRARAVRVVAAEELTNRPVHAFGFPGTRVRGCWAAGTVLGRTADGRVQIDDARSHGISLTRGFSGGPLVDREMGAVIGMVTEAERREERRTGYALEGRLLHDVLPALGEAGTQPNPFQGLEAFHESDAPRFFGREEQAASVVRRLEVEGLLIVSGPSGSGKSSLVLAGAVPRIRAPESDVVVFRPAAGTSPWLALAAVLIDHVRPGADLTETAELAARLSSADLENVLNRVLVRRGLRRLVVVVDQLDEALVRSPAETEALLRGLTEVVAVLRGSARVDLLVTVSSEHLGRLLGHPLLGARLQAHVLTLAAPGPRELREMIERPLESVGMPVLQEGLAEVILESVRDERNPLPLVEFTLALLWERQERGLLTHRSYRDIGGPAGSIAHYADEVWGVLAEDAAAEKLFRWLFCQLVSPLPGGAFVRRIVVVADLGPFAAVVPPLAATRLVTLSEDAAGEPIVEIAHEALVRHWERLRGWLEEEREFRLFQDEIDRQAGRWHRDRTRALLLRGERLRHARSVLRGDAASLTPRQRVFIRASIRGAVRRWVFRLLVADLIVSLVLSVSLTLYLVRDHSAEQNARRAAAMLLNEADEREAAFDGNMERVLMVLRAFRTADNENTADALRRWYRNLRHARLILSGDFSAGGVNPRGDLVMTGRKGNGVEIHDLGAPQVTSSVIPVDFSGMFSFAWLGADRLAVSGGGRIEIWDVRAVRRLKSLPVTADRLMASPSGRWLGWGSTYGRRFHLMDLEAAKPVRRALPLPGKLASVKQAAADAVNVEHVFDDGGLLIGHRGRTIALSEKGGRPWTGPPAVSVAAGPDGREVVSECLPGKGFALRLLRTGKVLARHRDRYVRCDAATDPVTTHAAFTGDGRHVALLDHGTEVITDRHSYLDIGPVNGPRRHVPTPLNHIPQRLSLLPSGGYRLFLSAARSLLVLEIPPLDPMDAALEAADDSEITGDGRYLITHSGRRLDVWDLSTRRRAGTATDVAMRIAAPGGRHVVTSDPGGRVVVRTLPGLSVRARPAGLADGTPRSPLAADDDRFVVTSSGGVVSVWSHGGERLSADIDPGRWDGSRQRTVLLRPGRPEIVVVEGGSVWRHSFSTGRTIAGSAFSMGEERSRRWIAVTPSLDPRGGSLMLVYREDGMEIWDLESQGREARLPISLIPEPASVNEAYFTGSGEVRLEVGMDANEPATSAVLWDRNRFLGLPKVLGRPDLQLRKASRDTPSGGWNIHRGQGERVEPADADRWVRRICEVVRNSPKADVYFGFANDSFAGEVC